MAKTFHISNVRCRLTVEVRRPKHAVIRTDKQSAVGRVRVLVLVEGMHDIEFLRRISLVLREADPRLPDLAQMERNQELIFVPTGGTPAAWSDRLSALGVPEFHLVDAETSPTTQARQQIAATINRRPQCRAFVTSHRSLENYLHPTAIDNVSWLKIEFGGTDDVPALVAQGSYEGFSPTTPWNELSPRARKRGCERAKRWLNTDAVEAMTPALLAERDPHGEITTWLATIAELAQCG